MKNLNLLAIVGLVMFSAQVQAEEAEVYGGTVYSKGNPGHKIAMFCTKQDADQNCEEFEMRSFYTYGAMAGHTQVLAVFRRGESNEAKKFNKKAYKHMSKDLNEDYLTAGFLMTAIMITSDKGSASALTFFPGLLVGVTFDLVKAPVVLAAWLGHRLGFPFAARHKIVKVMNFMMDPERQGDEKRVSSRMFNSFYMAQFK